MIRLSISCRRYFIAAAASLLFCRLLLADAIFFDAGVHSPADAFLFYFMYRLPRFFAIR